MANPNAVEVSEVYGNNALVLPTTVPTLVVNNPAGSNKVFKVNTLMVACVNSISTAQTNVSIYDQDDLEGSEHQLTSGLVVPVNASIIIIDSDTSIYLKENQSLGVYSGANNEVNIMASWEEISDV